MSKRSLILLQNNNLDWFPRMQAMSLVVTDGDGEQNEMRMLQDKLANTMNVVMTLTAQLNELKEQVNPTEPVAGSTQIWGGGGTDTDTGRGRQPPITDIQ